MKTKLRKLFALLAAFCGLQLFTATTALAAYTPKILINFGNDTATSSDTWTCYKETGAGGNLPATAYSQGGFTFQITGSGNFFPTGRDKFDAVENDFQTGTYTDVNGESHTSLLEEMAASLGVKDTTIHSSIYNTGEGNGGYNNHTGTIGGLDTSKKYVVYYVGGMKRGDSNSTSGGFQLSSTGYGSGTTPKVDYVTTVAVSPATVSTSYQSLSDITTNLKAGENGLLLVRVSNIKPNSEGKIIFNPTSVNKTGINCLAVAEEEGVETNAAKIGETEYATVAAAMTAVTSGQTITLLKKVNETLTAAATDFTLALGTYTLSGSLAVPTDSAIKLNLGSGTLSSTLTGSGTIIYDSTVVSTFPTTAPPGVSAAAWTGTVWFKGYNSDSKDRTVTSFRNDGSTVKYTSVRGFVAGGSVFSNVALEDSGDTPALDLDNGYGGWGSGKHVKISNLTGTGTLKTSWGGGGYQGFPLTLVNVSGFSGSLWAASSTGVGIYVGPALSTWSSANNGQIVLVSGGTASIASGKSWTAADGIVINGAISGAGTLASNTTFGNGAEIDISGGSVLTASGTLTFNATSTKVRVAETPTGDVKIINKSGTTAGAIATTVSLYVGTGTEPISGYTLAYKDDGVYLIFPVVRTHLTWNSTTQKWVTAGGDPVETITSDYVLDAANGDNITFGSAAAPYAFNMPNSGEVTINNQNNLTVSAINIPANVTLAIGANANPGFNVTGTGIFKYAASAADGTPVPAAKLANFNGTFWMAKGRHRYSGVAIAQTVTLKITDGATLMPEGSATTVWSNPIFVSGQGWGSSGVESCAVRLHENAQLGPNCTVTFEKVNGKNPTIGTTGTSLINAKLVGTDGFEVRGSGTLSLGTPKTQAAQLSGNIVVSGGTLRIGNGNNSGCSAGNEVKLGDATITVNSGAAVAAWCWTTAGQSALTTDKINIMTPITLNNGAQLNGPDGAHAFMGAVTVNGTASGSYSYHKGWAFANLIIPAGSTFNATCQADGSYNVYFSVLGGNVDGTLNVTNNGGNNKEMRVCVTGDALADGTLNIQNNGGNGAYLFVVGDTTIGAVTGNAAAAFGDGTSRTLTLNGGTYGFSFKDVDNGTPDPTKALNLVIAGNTTLSGTGTVSTCSGTLTVNAGATLTPGETNVLTKGVVTVNSGATLDVAGLRGVQCSSIAGAGTVAFTFTQAEAEAGSTPVVILAPADAGTPLTVPENVTFSDGSHNYTASVNADGALTVLPNEHLVVGAIHAEITADTAWADIDWLDAQGQSIGKGKDLSRTTTATLTADGPYTVMIPSDVTMNNITVSGDNTIKFVTSGGKLYAATAVINGKVAGNGIVAAAMTVADGAEIDTRFGNLACTGTVTFGGTTKVRVSALPTAGGQVTVIATPGTIGAAVPTMTFYVGDATEPTALPAGMTLVWGYNGLYVRDVDSDNPAYAAVDDPATHSRNWIWFDADCGSNLNTGDWENRSLPIGNARVGASVMENRDKVRLALNEISLWSGGTNKVASSYTYGPYATKDDFGSYQPFGDFFIEQPTLTGGTIKRALDLTTGVAQGEIVKDGITYTRRTYASRPAEVVITTLEANKLGAITGKFSLWPDHTATAESAVEDGKGVLKYNGTLANGMKFAATAYIVAEGGAVSTTRTGEEAIAVTYTGSGTGMTPSRTVNSAICVDGATKVTVVIAMNTDYICSDAENWVRDDDTPIHISATNALAAATLAANEPTMRTASVAAHQHYFNTCDVNLGATDAAQAALPTPTRLQNYKSGTKDTELEATLFQMGRYLLIGTSGSILPGNLQGLWNDKVYAPWAADYHTNINIQENYWSAEVTGLSDMHLSLFNWLHEAMPTMRADTAANFKCYTNSAVSVRGWTARVSQNPFGAGGWTQWNTPINAWYALHYWEHYQFTMDRDFLENTAYPVLKEASEFWCDYLKPLEKNDQGEVTNFRSSTSLTAEQTAQLNAMDAGTLVSPYGWSHEHGPNEDGVTFDQQLVRNLFNNTIAAAEALGVDSAFVAELTEKRSLLATNMIGKGSDTVAGGYLQEWLVDRPGMVDTSHRHTSHLMAVFPCNEINIYETPELLAAAANSLARRGEVSDSRRSWTWPWRGALWARMHNATKAHDQVEGLLKYNTLNNLWTTHTPYQIDGNLSYPAAVAEMLVQSQVKGQIELLPGADRTEWPSGSVTGIRARGAITVDFTWSDGKVTSYELKAATPTPVRLMYDGIAEDVVAPCSKTILPRVTVPSVGWKGDFAAGARRGFTMATDGVLVANGTAKIDSGFITVTPPAGNARYSAAVFTAKAPADGLYLGNVLYGMDVTATSGLEPGQEKGLMGIINNLVDLEGHAWAMWLGAPASSDPTRTPNLQPDLGAMGTAMRGYGDAIGLVEPASRFSVDGTTVGNGTGLKHTYVVNATTYTFGGRTDSASQRATDTEFGSIFIFRNEQLTQDELNLWTAPAVTTFQLQKHVELSDDVTLSGSTRALSVATKDELTLTIADGVSLETYGGLFANHKLTIDLRGWTAPGAVISGPIYSTDNITVQVNDGDLYQLTADGLILTKVGEQITYSATLPAGTAVNWENISWQPTGERPADADYTLVSGGNATLVLPAGGTTVGSLNLSGEFIIKAADATFTDGCWVKTILTFAPNALTADDCTFAPLPSGFEGKYVVTDTAILLYAQNKEVISVNIAGGRGTGTVTDATCLVAGTDYVGLAPVPGNSWVNVNRQWQSRAAFADKSEPFSVTGYIGTKSYAHITASGVCGANNTYTDGLSSSPIIHGYLDDGGYGTGTNAWIAVTGVPYSEYDVIVYASTDSANYQFRPVKVNGKTYTAGEGGVAVEGTDNWGMVRQTEVQFATNAMIVTGLTSPNLTVFGGNNASSGRGGIAAIQIICTGHVTEAFDFTADITSTPANWDNGEGEGLENQNIDWVNSPEATITLTNLTPHATLTLDTDILAKSFKIVSAAGCDLTIVTNGTAAIDIAAYDFSEAAGGVTYDMAATAPITVGATTVFTQKANPIADIIIPNGVHYGVDGLTVTRARGEGVFTKTGDGEATLTYGYKATGAGQGEPFGIEVTGGTLTLGHTRFFASKGDWYNNVGIPITVTGGTLDLNHVYTFATTAKEQAGTDLSGWLTQQTITLGSGAVITNGNVTFYNTMAGVDAIRYLGGNGANEPATFAANWHGSYSNGEYHRTINVEKGAGEEYDLLFSGDIGIADGTNPGLFATSVVHKAGLGTIKVTGARNFPGLSIEAGKWIVAGPVNDTHAPNAFINVEAGAIIDYATPDTMVLLPTLRGAGTVTHSATGMAARLKFGDTSGFTGTIDIPENAVVATPTPLRNDDTTFTVAGEGKLMLMLTQAQRGYIDPYMINMKAASGFTAEQIVICDEMGNPVPDHVARIDDDGNVWFELAGDSIVFWDNDDACWTNKNGEVVAESAITATTILSTADGDEVSFNSDVTPLALSLPSEGTVTFTEGFTHLGLASIGVSEGVTLKVTFPQLTEGDITPYAITNHFGGGGTLELALADDCQYATSLPVTAANFPSGYAINLKVSAGQFKATSVLPANVTIEAVDGAQFFISGGTWDNTFVLSGNGYNQSAGSRGAWDATALRFDNATLSANATIRLVDDGTTDAPAIGNYFASTCNARFDGADVRVRSDYAQLTFATPASFGGYEGDVTIENGAIQYGNNNATAGTEYNMGGSVTVNTGATLTFKLGASKTPSYVFGSELIYNGGKVALNDGALTMNSVNVLADSTYEPNWNKKQIIKNLTGADGVTFTLDLKNTKYDNSEFEIQDGDFAGTIAVKADNAHCSDFMPIGTALSNATVNVGANIKLVTDTTTVVKTIKMLNNTCLKNNAATVNAGTTLDLNGTYGASTSITLNGGTLVNNGASTPNTQIQTPTITLTADSEIGGTGNFYMIASDYNASTLTLNGHTLRKTGGNTFYLCNTTAGVDNETGIISIDEGTLSLHNTGSRIKGTVRLNGGTLLIPSGMSSAIWKLDLVSGTLTNNGTISEIVSLNGIFNFNQLSGTWTFGSSLAVSGGGVVLSSATATALAGKVVTVAENTIFNFGDATNARTAVIDQASVGIITVKLTAEEYEAYQGTGEWSIDIPCNATAAGEFGGTFYFLQPGEGWNILFAAKSIVDSGSGFVIRATRPTATRKPPFTTTVTSNCTWSAAGWVDADNVPVQKADWASASLANVTLNVGSGGDYTVTLDTTISLGTITIVNAGTVRFDQPAEYGITIGTVDDSQSTGTTYLHPTDAAYDITAGANTVMEEANKGGTLTVGDGKKATVVYPWTGTVTLNAGGYLKYTGECATALDMSTAFQYANATVELAGTFTLEGAFGASVNGGKLITSGNVTVQNDEARLISDENDRFEVAGGTLTMTGRIGAPKWGSNGNGTIDVTGGTVTATGNGFFYPGSSINAGTLTLNITDGTFEAPFNPWVSAWTHQNTVNVSGTGVFAPANLWTSNGGKPTTDDTSTSRAAQTTVNLTGGAFNVPAGVPDWVVVNVDGDATLGIQSGVSRAAVYSPVTVAAGQTLTVDVPAGQTNEFKQAILGTGSIRKTGGGILMFTHAMPDVGLTIEGGIVGFKLSSENVGLYKGGVLELYAGDDEPTAGTVFVADENDFTSMLPINNFSVKDGKVVISKYKFPIVAYPTEGFTTTTAGWVDSENTPYEDGFDHAIAGMIVYAYGEHIDWTNDVELVVGGTIQLAYGELAIWNKDADSSIAAETIDCTGHDYAEHLHFDTGAADIIAGSDTYLYGSGTGAMSVLQNVNCVHFVSYNDGMDITYSGVISGDGAVVKEGDGKTYLAGVNTYTGGTTIQGGTLVAHNDQALGTGAVVVKAGTMLGKQATKPLKCASVTVENDGTSYGVISLREQTAITADQFKITTGNGNNNALTLQGTTAGENIARFFQVSDQIPDGKWVQAGNWISKSTGSSTIHDVLWENVNGKATKVDNISLSSLTLNFSDSSGMNSAIIGGEGRVKITKIRFAQRNNTTSDITALKLTQDGVTVEATVTKEGTIDIVKTDNTIVTRPAFVCTFDSDITFKTYRPITVTFNNNSAAGMAVIQPANTTFGYNGYTPVIEVTGDYTTWQARTISVNFGVYNTAYTQVSGEYGVVPSGKWRNMSGPENQNGTQVYASDDVASAMLYWYSDRGETITSDNTYENLMRNTLEGNGTGWIRLTGIPFQGYDVIVYQQNIPKGTAAGQTFQFNPPAINGIYYSYDGSQKSIVANDPALRYGRTNQKTPVEGANGNVVYVKGAFSGDLYIKAAGNPTDGGLYGGIAAIQVVERTDVSIHYATIPADAASPYDFSDLTWTPAEPDEGFTTVAILNVTNLAANATLKFDRAVSANRINFVGNGDLTIAAIGGEGTVRPNIVKWDTSAVKGTVTHAGDVRSRVDFKLGDGTLFNGSFGGKIVSMPEWGVVRWAQDNVALTMSELPVSSNAIVMVDNGSIVGDFTARADATLYLDVIEGQTVALNAADAAKTLDLNLWVEGGRVDVTATDRTTLVPGREYLQTDGYVNFAASGAGTAEANSIKVRNTEGTFVMNIMGGTTDVSRTSFRMGGNTTISLSDGTLLLKNVYRDNTEKSHAINIGGSGTLFAPAGGIIDVPINVSGTSYIGAGDGQTLIVRGAVTGLDKFQLCNEGTGRVIFMCALDEKLTGVPEGAYVGYRETDINQNGTLGVLTPDPASTPIVVFKIDGVTEYDEVTRTDSAFGTTTLKFASDFQGELCWWDYEFDRVGGKTGGENTGTDKSGLSWDGSRPGGGNGPQDHDFTNDGTSLLVRARPWRNLTAYPAASTFVYYGTAPASNNTYIVTFGSGTSTTTQAPNRRQLFFATGDVSKREVELVYYDAGDRNWAHRDQPGGPQKPIVLCTLTVPYLSTQKHLYAFTIKKNSVGDTEIDVYLDGKLVQPYVSQYDMQLGPGFQVAGPFGGQIDYLAEAECKYRRIATSGDEASIDFLRVYDKVLDSAVLMSMAEAYPFENPQGAYVRRTYDEGEKAQYPWNETQSWTLSSNGVEYAEHKVDYPAQGTDAKLYTSNDTVMAVNLPNKVGLVKLDVNGTGTVDFTYDTEEPEVDPEAKKPANRLHMSGLTSIYTDVHTDRFALDFEGANVYVADGKTLTFDMSELPLSNYTENVMYTLTGYTTLGTGAKIDYVQPIAETNGTVFGRATMMVKDSATDQYQLYVLTRLQNDVAAGEEHARNTWSSMTNSLYWTPGADLAKEIWSAGPKWQDIALCFNATNGDAVVTFDQDVRAYIIQVSGTNNVTLRATNGATVIARKGDTDEGWYDFRDCEGRVTVEYDTTTAQKTIYLGHETSLVGGANNTATLVVDEGIHARVYLTGDDPTWHGTTRVAAGGTLEFVTGATQETKSLALEPGSELTVITNTTDAAAIKVTSSGVNLDGVVIKLDVIDSETNTIDHLGGSYNVVSATGIYNADKADYSEIEKRGVWTHAVVTKDGRQILQLTKKKAVYIAADSHGTTVTNVVDNKFSFDLEWGRVKEVTGLTDADYDTAAVAAALAEQPEGAGMKNWEAVVLGLKENTAATQPVIMPKQTATAGMLTLTMPTLTPDDTTAWTDIGVKVLTGDTREYGTDETPAGLTWEDEEFSAALPATGVKYYKLQYELKHEVKK